MFRVLSHEFGVVRLYRTFSIYIVIGETRCAGCLCSSAALVELFPLRLEWYLPDAKSKPNPTPSGVRCIRILGLWSLLGPPLVAVEMEWGGSALVNCPKGAVAGWVVDDVVFNYYVDND